MQKLNNKRDQERNKANESDNKNNVEGKVLTKDDVKENKEEEGKDARTKNDYKGKKR